MPSRQWERCCLSLSLGCAFQLLFPSVSEAVLPLLLCEIVLHLSAGMQVLSHTFKGNTNISGANTMVPGFDLGLALHS